MAAAPSLACPTLLFRRLRPHSPGPGRSRFPIMEATDSPPYAASRRKIAMTPQRRGMIEDRSASTSRPGRFALTSTGSSSREVLTDFPEHLGWIAHSSAPFVVSCWDHAGQDTGARNYARLLERGLGSQGRPSRRRRTGLGQLLQPQRQHDPRPAIEDHVDADEETDDPEAGKGPLLPNQDPQDQIQYTAGTDPAPVREPVWVTVDSG